MNRWTRLTAMLAVLAGTLAHPAGAQPTLRPMPPPDLLHAIVADAWALELLDICFIGGPQAMKPDALADLRRRITEHARRRHGLPGAGAVLGAGYIAMDYRGSTASLAVTEPAGRPPAPLCARDDWVVLRQAVERYQRDRTLDAGARR